MEEIEVSGRWDAFPKRSRLRRGLRIWNGVRTCRGEATPLGWTLNGLFLRFPLGLLLRWPLGHPQGLVAHSLLQAGGAGGSDYAPGGSPPFGPRGLVTAPPAGAHSGDSSRPYSPPQVDAEDKGGSGWCRDGLDLGPTDRKWRGHNRNPDWPEANTTPFPRLHHLPALGLGSLIPLGEG